MLYLLNSRARSRRQVVVGDLPRNLDERRLTGMPGARIGRRAVALGIRRQAGEPAGRAAAVAVGHCCRRRLLPEHRDVPIDPLDRIGP